ncbi:MAG: PAS domain S-box protein [Blastocatellia bacterium]|nr:PAS domain S-box protein [Blastocatellia bacterium]
MAERIKQVSEPQSALKPPKRAATLESIRFQAHLLDTVEQSVIATNLDGIVIYWNQFAQQLYGWSSAEAIGRHIMELTTPDVMEEQALEIMAHLSQGESWTGEFEVQRRDGTTFPAQIINSPINEDNGTLIGILGVSSDITERKRVEQALRESESKYRLLVEQASDGIHTYDMEGNIIETNSRLCEMLGYTSEELLRLNVKDLIPAADLAVDPIRFDELRAGKTILRERRLRRKDGVLLPVEISGRMIRDNVLQAIIRDSTERKRQEESLIELTRQLERQSNLFDTTLSSITDFAYIFDRDGRFLYANQPLLDLWGLKLDEAVGKNFFELQYPDDLALRLQQQIQQVIDTRQGLRDETPYTSPAGDEGFYEYIFTPVFAADGTVEAVAGSTRDYTERKQAEQALRSSEAKLQKSHEELERRVAERTTALSDMNAILQEEVGERRRIEVERVELLRRIVFAQEDERRRIAREMHDQFGQQLTALNLKLDAVKEDCGDDKNLHEQVEALQMIARQLDEDVDHMVWQMRPTALDDLGLQAALSTYVENWSKHFGVPVQLHASGLDEDRLMPEVETALYRIAQEALNNVAKHAHATQVAIVLERRAGQVSLIVEDDGIGFDWQRQFVADDKGLGLIGMRERAALVGGTIEFESQPTEGATVVVRIPVPPGVETGHADE